MFTLTGFLVGVTGAPKWSSIWPSTSAEYSNQSRIEPAYLHHAATRSSCVGVTCSIGSSSVWFQLCSSRVSIQRSAVFHLGTVGLLPNHAVTRARE